MTEQKKAQPLGRILLRQKLISQAELDGALVAAKQGGKHLASQLIDQGLVKEVDAVRALSEQHGVPGIDLSQVAIFLEHLVVPREVAEAHKILPVLMKGDRLFLAMANPSDTKVIDELEFVTGKKVYPYVALSGVLARAISAAYDAKGQSETYYLGANVSRETLEKLGLSGSQASEASHDPGFPGMPPEPPQPVVDAATEASAANLDINTREFGNVGVDDSSVTRLPVELQAKISAATSAVSGPASGKLILVVDDEDEIRKLLRRLLTEKGYRVIEADRGLLALRMVKEQVPDLIILDAMLPEIHGFDIARRIKGSEKYGAIPIVMISAVYRGWRIAEDLKNSHGIEEYLEKPFRIAEVFAAVQRALATRQSHPKMPEPDRDAMSGEAEKALERGIAAYKEGNMDEAIAHLVRGIGIDPLAFRLRFHLGLLYGKKGLLYEGIQELEKSVEINPKSFPALKNLAVLYEKAGFRHKAVEMWERCVQAAPDADTRAQIKQHLVGLL